MNKPITERQEEELIILERAARGLERQPILLDTEPFNVDRWIGDIAQAAYELHCATKGMQHWLELGETPDRAALECLAHLAVNYAAKARILASHLPPADETERTEPGIDFDPRATCPGCGDKCIEGKVTCGRMSCGSSAGRKPYSPPTLTRLGTVAELTKGGQGTVDDMMGGLQPTPAKP